MSPSRPTLHDVAVLAGVSVGTASSVFSQRQRVAEHTRDTVLRAAAELGYQPRRMPGALTVKGVTTIGLLARSMHHSPAANPYAAVLQGAQRAAAELGLTMAVDVASSTGSTPLLPLIVRRREAQGLLVLGRNEPSLLDGIHRSGMPCVLVDHTVDELPIDSVRVDDRRGGALATDHLLGLNHRDPVPAVIMGPGESFRGTDRYAGYRTALAAHGLKPDPAYICRAPDADPSGGRLAMDQLLDLPRPPTAVLCWSDTAAVGALQALRERNVAVPQQCSVIGYGDVHLASTTIPPLSTVKADRELLGAQGIWHLVQRIRQPRLPRRVTYVDVRLVVRSSTSRATGVA